MLPLSCTVELTSPLPVSRICSDSTKLATLPKGSAPRLQWRVPPLLGARLAINVTVTVSDFTPAATEADGIWRTNPRMHGVTNASYSGPRAAHHVHITHHAQLDILAHAASAGIQVA